MIKDFDNNPFAFLCYVEEEGYEWVKGRADSEPRLVGRGGLESRMIVRNIPLGTFTEFANLKPERDAIVRFAKRYGDPFEQHGDLQDVVVQRGRMQLGSPLKKWEAEIGDMHALVCIWEATRKKRKKELRKIITWNTKGVRYSIKTPKQGCGAYLAHSDDPEDRLSRFRRGDVLWPAKYALQAELNRRISSPESVTPPRLVWTRKSLGPGRPERAGDLVMVFRPPNLLASMWLQFAQAISGGYGLTVCQGCGKHFLTGPGVRRPDAETCNANCRQRKKRAKK